jgi:phosphoenolpyruvate synthase/pyruvate phosphate dikinase
MVNKEKKRKVVWLPLFTRGHHPLFLIDTFYNAHRKYFGKATGLGFNLKYYQRSKEKTIFAQHEIKKIFSFIKKNSQNLNYFQKLLSSYLLAKFSTQKFAQKIYFLKHRQLSDQEINFYLKKMFILLEKLLAYLYYPVWAGDVMGQILRKKLSEENKNDIPVNDFITLTAIKSLSPSRRAEIELIKLAPKLKKIRDNKVIFDLLEKHRLKFLGCHFYFMSGPLYSHSEILRKLKKIAKLSFKEINEKDKIIKIFKKYKFSQETKKYLKIVKKMSSLRDQRINDLGQIYALLFPFLSEVAKRMKITYEGLSHLTENEILSRNFSKKDIEERKKEYLYLVENCQKKIIIGQDLKKYSEKKFENKKIKSFSGSIAQNGRAKGKVIIADNYTLYKIKKGNILVAAMTTPNMTPYLKKIRAIITDEGGITCHAAVIARELGIPCVIGTKIATQVLKDGDRVEVDADKGIVRILK